jgi:addiction module RelB/DinJ family antitoxin
METTLTIKTKKELRNKVKATAQELGLPITVVVNALLKQFVRDREIVLSLNVPNAETKRAMREARAGKGLKTFKTFEDFKKHVQSL